MLAPAGAASSALSRMGARLSLSLCLSLSLYMYIYIYT